MNDRRRLTWAALILLAIAAACLALGVATASSARADDPYADTQPCVANREANSLTTRQTRADLEARWEVTGLGRQRVVMGRTYVAYPWCGYQGMGVAFIGVRYVNDLSVEVLWWKADWSVKPQGRQ